LLGRYRAHAEAALASPLDDVVLSVADALDYLGDLDAAAPRGHEETSVEQIEVDGGPAVRGRGLARLHARRMLGRFPDLLRCGG
jgi:hypothetical protein